jgi:hypothetical protein
MFKNVFGDLADALLEIRYPRKQNHIYSDIIANYGNSLVLDFILKAYRFFIRRIRRMFFYSCRGV